MPDLNYEVVTVAMSMIREPSEPARQAIDPDKIRELAESIKEDGLKHPIILDSSSSPYEIVEGHRRYLAHQFLGLPDIPAYLREHTEEQKLIGRAIENIQRENLNIIEKGLMFKRLMAKLGITATALSKRLGLSIQSVTHALDCLDLPEWVKEAIATKLVSYNSILEIGKIEEPVQREMYWKYAIENGITMAVAKQWYSGWKRMKDIEKERRYNETVMNPVTGSPVLCTCRACMKATDINTMTLVYLCGACVRFIFEGGPSPGEDH